MSEAPPERVVFDLLDAAATAVVAVDEDAVIRYVNARSLEVFGYSQDELLGQRIELLVPRARAAAHVAQRNGYLVAPVPRPLDERRDLKGARKDGSEFAAEISLTPLATADGPWVIASVLDISQRRDAEERVRQQSRSYLALARLNEAVATAEDTTTLFRRVCNVAVVHGGFVGALVVTHGEGTSVGIKASAGPLATRLAVASADHGLDSFISEQVNNLRRAGVADPRALTALTSGEATFTDDFSAEGHPHGYLAGMVDVRSGAVLPLRSRGRVVASFCLYSDRPDIFNDNLRDLLLGAANNISLALDRFEARAELDRALAQRTELLHRLVDAQERERGRIAADVHDESVQSLAAADLRLGLLERKAQGIAPDLLPDVARIHETVTGVSDQLRHLLFELEPIGDEATLTHLLAEAAAHVFELTPVAWRMENDADPAEQTLSTTVRTQAVRIVKEALVNVAKHAQAAAVAITVALDEDGVAITVADDGIGIPPGVRRSPPGHRGISGMRDRAEVAGGRLDIEPTAPGTTVSVWLPRY